MVHHDWILTVYDWTVIERKVWNVIEKIYEEMENTSGGQK